VDDLWAPKSEGVGLSVRAISFQDFRPMWSWSTNVTDRQTTCDRNTALCTKVHRAVKMAFREVSILGIDLLIFKFSSSSQYLSFANLKS